MKSSIPAATRTEYLNGDVTPKVRVTLRRTRLDFGVELYYENDSTIPGVIVDLPPVVEVPTAVFHLTSADGSSPEGYAPFTATVIDESIGDPDEWLWEWGDGETSTSPTPGVHEYVNSGTYTVSLTVGNSQGSHKLTREEYVYVMTSHNLVAWFRFFDPDGRDAPFGPAPLTVTIENCTYFDPVEWLWTFDDGSTSTLEDPGSHVYESADVYSPSLRVRWANGVVDTADRTDYVHVGTSPPSPGEQLYVSVLGSDSTGDGTILSPWRHIQYGVDRMVPGTTLNIRAGRYHEKVSLTNLKGTANNWYTLKSYDGASDPSNKDKAAIIDGEYIIPTGVAHKDSGKLGSGSEEMVLAGLVKLLNVEYVKFDGIHVTRSRGRGINSTVDIDEGKTGGHITFLNCHVYSCRASVTKTNDYTNVTISGGQYYDSMNYCKRRRPTVKQSGEWDLPWAGAMTISRGADHLVKNVLLHTSYGEGLHPFTWAGGVVQDNIVFNCMNGMLPTTCCDGTVMQRNFVYSTRHEPFETAAMLNITMESGDHDIRRKVSRNCRFINNICVDGNVNNRFMDRLGKEGVLAYGFYRNSVVAHNTLVQHASSTTRALIRWLPMTHNNDIATIGIHNNIYWCQGPGADVIELGTGNPQPDYRYNCWYPKPSTVQPNETAALGAGDYYGDPVMINPNANLTADGSLGYDIIRAQAEKYMLHVESTVLGKGRNTQGDTYPVEYDFWGNSRGTSPDMGAHERS